MKWIWVLMISSIGMSELPPNDWYIPDHDTESKTVQIKKIRNFAKKVNKTTKSLDRAFRSFNRKLKNHKKSSWKPVAIATSFSLTSQGRFGILATTGTASAGLVWMHKSYNPGPKTDIPFSDNLQHQIPDYDLSCRENLKSEIQPAVEAAYKTGLIHAPKSTVEESLLEAGRQLLEATDGISVNNQTWSPRALQMSVHLTAGGRWSNIVSASTVISLNLAWRNRPRGNPFKKPTALTILLNNLSKEIDAAIRMSPQDLTPAAVRVAIGANINGDIGIGFGGTGIQFEVILGKDTKPKPQSLKTAQIRLASARHTNQFIQFKNGSSESSVIPRPKFQKGLRKALKISKFFVKRARSFQNSWKPRAIFIGFQIAMSGDLTLVTAGINSKLSLIYPIPERRKI